MVSCPPFSLIFFFSLHVMDGLILWFLLLSPLFPIYFLFLALSLTHTHIYPWPYLQPFSWYLHFCYHTLHPYGFFLIAGMLLLRSLLFIFCVCNVFHPLSAFIGVCLCEKFSCPSSLVFLQFVFVFYLFILVPIFWVRDFSQRSGNACWLALLSESGTKKLI